MAILFEAHQWVRIIRAFGYVRFGLCEGLLYRSPTTGKLQTKHIISSTSLLFSYAVTDLVTTQAKSLWSNSPTPETLMSYTGPSKLQAKPSIPLHSSYLSILSLARSISMATLGVIFQSRGWNGTMKYMGTGEESFSESLMPLRYTQ